MNSVASKMLDNGQMNSAETKPVFELVLFRDGQAAGPVQENQRPGPAEDADQRLNIAVVFTCVEATLAALKEAGSLASRLGARITLLVPQVVPYPLPLETPPVLIDFNERRFRVIASESPVETSVQIYLCRDQFETLARVLSPGSLVVLGGRKRWWPTREKSLASKLHRVGHEVVFKEME